MYAKEDLLWVIEDVDIAVEQEKLNVVVLEVVVRLLPMILVQHVVEEDIIHVQPVTDMAKLRMTIISIGERMGAVMEPKEWDYNEVLALVAKEMGVELDEDDSEEENEMKCLGVKSATVYVGGRKLPDNPTTKIYCSGPIGDININFDNND